jgi:hypothetical protein
VRNDRSGSRNPFRIGLLYHNTTLPLGGAQQVVFQLAVAIPDYGDIAGTPEVAGGDVIHIEVGHGFLWREQGVLRVILRAQEP